MVALIAATACVSLTTRTAFADSNDGVSRSQFTSSYPVATFEDCNGSNSCSYFSVQYDWSGYWGEEEWSIDSPPYNYDLDYENNTNNGWIFAGGVTLNGRNENISTRPAQWIDECWSSRSDCGSEYQDYDTANDSHTRPSAVTCGGNDWCVGIQVQNFERDGYIDPAIFSGTCAWPTNSSNATPWSGICSSGGIYYDMGQ